ncbi:MAG: hypothetical protein Q9226_008099 [Calogaya cf. arnoldii]
MVINQTQGFLRNHLDLPKHDCLVYVSLFIDERLFRAWYRILKPPSCYDVAELVNVGLSANGGAGLFGGRVSDVSNRDDIWVFPGPGPWWVPRKRCAARTPPWYLYPPVRTILLFCDDIKSAWIGRMSTVDHCTRARFDVRERNHVCTKPSIAVAVVDVNIKRLAADMSVYSSLAHLEGCGLRGSNVGE